MDFKAMSIMALCEVFVDEKANKPLWSVEQSAQSAPDACSNTANSSWCILMAPTRVSTIVERDSSFLKGSDDGAEEEDEMTRQKFLRAEHAAVSMDGLFFWYSSLDMHWVIFSSSSPGGDGSMSSEEVDDVDAYTQANILHPFSWVSTHAGNASIARSVLDLNDLKDDKSMFLFSIIALRLASRH